MAESLRREQVVMTVLAMCFFLFGFTHFHVLKPRRSFHIVERCELFRQDQVESSALSCYKLTSPLFLDVHFWLLLGDHKNEFLYNQL